MIQTLGGLPFIKLSDGTPVLAVASVESGSNIKTVAGLPYIQLANGSLVLATVLVGANGEPISTGVTGSTLLTGLVSSWLLGEGTGLTRVDSHGTNHLSDNGTVAQVDGVNGKAAEFGTGKWLSIAANPTLQVGSGSFELVGWANSPNLALTDQVGILVGRWSNTNEYEFLVYFTNARFKFAIGNAAGTGLTGQVESPGSLSSATDYLVRVQYDITVPSISIAINGGAFETSLVAPPSVGATAAELRFGKGEDANPFYNTLHMNHWNLWNRKLTDIEWDTLWNSGAGVVYPFTGLP